MATSGKPRVGSAKLGVKATHGGGTVRAKVVKIGNSQGVRIPKTFLNQIGLQSEGEVEFSIVDGGLMIRPIAQHPRHGWEEQFKLMHERGEDQLLDDIASTSEFDEKEWEW